MALAKWFGGVPGSGGSSAAATAPEQTKTTPSSGDYKQFGFENFGNTCYANSVLQALYFCHPFRELVLQTPDHSNPSVEPLPIIAPSTPPPPTPAPLTRIKNSRKQSSPDVKSDKNAANAPPLPVTGPPIPLAPPTLFSALRSLYAHISNNTLDKGTVAPRAFIEKVRKENELFRGLAHQDAHEFLNYLLNKVAEEIEEEVKYQSRSSSGEDLSKSVVSTTSSATNSATHDQHTPIHNLFEGVLTSETRCLTCESVSARDEAFLDLSIDIEQNSSVTACLRQFSASEMLCQKNKFFCDMCCGLQEAEKRMKIKKLPNILALHLKRFKYQEDKYIKLAYRVAFPLELRLFNTVDDSENPDRLFELFAIVVHIGNGPNHGHYIAIVKSRGSWVVFDDESVETIKEADIHKYFGDVGNQSAYVLYYQAVDLDLGLLGLRQTANVESSGVAPVVEILDPVEITITEPLSSQSSTPSHPPGLPRTEVDAKPKRPEPPAQPVPSSPQPQLQKTPSTPPLKVKIPADVSGLSNTAVEPAQLPASSTKQPSSVANHSTSSPVSKFSHFPFGSLRREHSVKPNGTPTHAHRLSTYSVPPASPAQHHAPLSALSPHSAKENNVITVPSAQDPQSPSPQSVQRPKSSSSTASGPTKLPTQTPPPPPPPPVPVVKQRPHKEKSGWFSKRRSTLFESKSKEHVALTVPSPSTVRGSASQASEGGSGSASATASTATSSMASPQVSSETSGSMVPLNHHTASGTGSERSFTKLQDPKTSSLREDSLISRSSSRQSESTSTSAHAPVPLPPIPPMPLPPLPSSPSHSSSRLVHSGPDHKKSQPTLSSRPKIKIDNLPKRMPSDPHTSQTLQSSLSSSSSHVKPPSGQPNGIHHSTPLSPLPGTPVSPAKSEKLPYRPPDEAVKTAAKRRPVSTYVPRRPPSPVKKTPSRKLSLTSGVTGLMGFGRKDKDKEREKEKDKERTRDKEREKEREREREREHRRHKERREGDRSGGANSTAPAPPLLVGRL